MGCHPQAAFTSMRERYVEEYIRWDIIRLSPAESHAFGMSFSEFVDFPEMDEVVFENDNESD